MEERATQESGNADRQAGADCISVFNETGKEILAELVREIDAPINILAVYGSPMISELVKLGIAGASFGLTHMRATPKLVRSIAEELK